MCIQKSSYEWCCSGDKIINFIFRTFSKKKWFWTKFLQRFRYWKKNFRSQFFNMKKDKQRVKKYIKKFSTWHTLTRSKNNVAEFELKFLHSVRFWIKSNTSFPMLNSNLPHYLYFSQHSSPYHQKTLTVYKKLCRSHSSVHSSDTSCCTEYNSDFEFSLRRGVANFFPFELPN